MLKTLTGVGVMTLAVIMFGGCLHRDTELVYVFPDGFHGVAKIRSNHSTGVTLEARDEGMERRVTTSATDICSTTAKPLLSFIVSRRLMKNKS